MRLDNEVEYMHLVWSVQAVGDFHNLDVEKAFLCIIAKIKELIGYVIDVH